MVVRRVIVCPSDVLVDWFLGGGDNRDCEDVDARLGFYAIELWCRCELCLLLGGDMMVLNSPFATSTH